MNTNKILGIGALISAGFAVSFGVMCTQLIPLAVRLGEIFFIACMFGIIAKAIWNLE